MTHIELLTKAHDAATAAIRGRFEGGLIEHPYNCGFAWVQITGTCSLAKTCREERAGADASGDITIIRANNRFYGDKGLPGWTFWCPGTWPLAGEFAQAPVIYGQDVDFLLAAAKAFAAVLIEAGVRAVPHSRLD